MANYNHAHYIGEALEAILSQDFKPLEVIVVDDGSTDDSVEVINEVMKREPVVRLLRNDRNSGPAFSHTRGMKYASGDYVFLAAADDKVLPGFFEKSMELLARHPEVGLCCSDPGSFDGSTGIVNENRRSLNSNSPYFSPAEITARLRQGGFDIAGHTCLIRRSAILEVGGLIPELRWHCDWFALQVVAFRYGLCYIPECLSLIRIHPGSYSSIGRKGNQQTVVLRSLLRFLRSREYRDVFPLFVESKVAEGFGPPLLKALVADPMNWIGSTRVLLWPMLCNETRRRREELSRSAPPLVKAVYRRLLKRQRRR